MGLEIVCDQANQQIECQELLVSFSAVLEMKTTCLDRFVTLFGFGMATSATGGFSPLSSELGLDLKDIVRRVAGEAET